MLLDHFPNQHTPRFFGGQDARPCDGLVKERELSWLVSQPCAVPFRGAKFHLPVRATLLAVSAGKR